MDILNNALQGKSYVWFHKEPFSELFLKEPFISQKQK